MSKAPDLRGPETLDVLTCADANFFHFLPSFERNVYRRFGRFPVVYDLGFNEGQPERLKSRVDKAEFDDSFGDKTPTGFIRTTHKPDCILHFLQTQPASCLYADADTFFIRKVDESVLAGCDVAVTPRHPRELRAANPFENGKINAGVMYFRNTQEVRDFVAAWQKACADRSISDQRAMSDLLNDADLTGDFGMTMVNGLKVLKLDPMQFNDTGCAHGDIWHFKNAGRRLHKKWRRTFVGVLDDLSPALLSHYASLRKRRQSV